MKFLFVVQGEGRGHLTQAIALNEMLTKNGHQVIGVLVGKSNFRELPTFFLESIQAPVSRFASPNFLPTAKNKKKPSLLKSLAYNHLKIGIYLKSIHFIRKKIKELEPDVVINFYELLVGLTYSIFPPKVPYVCIAHQYILLHPDFQFPKESKIELYFLKFFTRITCIKASKLLALSFRKMDNVPKRNIVVVPPILRKEVLKSQPEAGEHLLGYMLNNTFADEIIRVQSENPDVSMRFFWDKKGADETTVINDKLSFHKLNDKLFVNYMSSCSGYATTAGFESVCEAMYLGKPILMVPTHIEQACNAYDAALSGAGIVSSRFDLGALINFIPYYKQRTDFHDWVQQSEWYTMRELTFEKEDLMLVRLSYRFILGWE